MPPPARCGEPGPELDALTDAVCDLDGGHTGPHADLYEGWEWSQ